MMGPLEIAGNQDAPPGSAWDGPWCISSKTEAAADSVSMFTMAVVAEDERHQPEQMTHKWGSGQWSGWGPQLLRTAGPWHKACKGSCPMLQPLIPQDFMPQQLCPVHIYSRTCLSKSGPFCSYSNLWSELNPLKQKDYTSLAEMKSLSQLATGRWEGSLVVMQLSSNNPALSGSHIELKKPCTRHAIALISSIGFINVLNISGNFFLLPWCCQRHPVHHCECEDLIPATACMASGHQRAEQQCGLISRVPVSSAAESPWTNTVQLLLVPLCI